MKKLLVVDDEHAICEFVQAVGEACGFRVDACIDEARILSTVAAAKPDVIVLDLTMPNVDGVEILRMLAAERNPAAIFIMSGFDARVRDIVFDLGKVLGLSMAGVVPKPVRASELKNLLAPHAS